MCKGPEAWKNKIHVNQKEKWAPCIGESLEKTGLQPGVACESLGTYRQAPALSRTRDGA